MRSGKTVLSPAFVYSPRAGRAGARVDRSAVTAHHHAAEPPARRPAPAPYRNGELVTARDRAKRNAELLAESDRRATERDAAHPHSTTTTRGATVTRCRVSAAAASRSTMEGRAGTMPKSATRAAASAALSLPALGGVSINTTSAPAAVTRSSSASIRLGGTASTTGNSSPRRSPHRAADCCGSRSSTAQEPERNRQRYTASVGVVYRHSAVRVSGRYRGTARFGLGDESDVALRLSHLVNVTLRLDLAKLR